MNRTPINPTDWGKQFLMNQGEIVEGATRSLRCSGQVAVVPDSESDLGISVVAHGDIRGQIVAALSNVDDVLSAAGMDRSNIVFVNFFTTDIDGFLENYAAYAEWISEVGTMPPQSLIGVARLVMPELLVEIEVSAAA